MTILHMNVCHRIGEGNECVLHHKVALKYTSERTFIYTCNKRGNWQTF